MSFRGADRQGPLFLIIAAIGQPAGQISGNATSGLYVEAQRPRGGCNLLVVICTSNDFKGYSDKTYSFASSNRKRKFPLSE
jgi:hypothetical protein